MPIKRGNIDIPRLRGDGIILPMRRIYLGDNLVYGLYDVKFFDRRAGSDYEPKIYAWGYSPECVEFEIPLDAPEYVDTYLTHWGDSRGNNGWHESNLLNNPKGSISMNDHRNLYLYGRWRQHKFTFSSVVKYDEWEEYPVYDIDKRTSIDDPDFMGYGNDYYWDEGLNPYATADGTIDGTNCLPNCTCYAYGRCLEVGIDNPVNGTPSGSGWGRASSQYDIIDYDPDKLDPGDCISWERTSEANPAGHVAFYEGDGMVSASGWISYNHVDYPFNNKYRISQYWYSGEGASNAHAFNYKTIDGESTWGGNGETPYKIIKTSQGLDPSYEWRFKRTVTQTGPSGEVDSPDFPTVPDTGIIESEEKRNPRYDSFTAVTSERQIHYPIKGYGSWQNDWSQISSAVSQPSPGDSWVSGWSQTW